MVIATQECVKWKVKKKKNIGFSMLVLNAQGSVEQKY
jgi:hypothetical protein